MKLFVLVLLFIWAVLIGLFVIYPNFKHDKPIPAPTASPEHDQEVVQGLLNYILNNEKFTITKDKKYYTYSLTKQGDVE